MDDGLLAVRFIDYVGVANPLCYEMMMVNGRDGKHLENHCFVIFHKHFKWSMSAKAKQRTNGN